MLLQATPLAAVAALIAWLVHNLVDNLTHRGIMIGFDFLGRAARFPISESLLAYDPTDSFAWALAVGLANTLYISMLVIAGSTALGFAIGLARRSSHPFARALSSAYVDAIRNTPLIVQLLFWYSAVTIGLPPSSDAASLPLGVYLTDRGLYLPRALWSGHALPLVLTLCLGALVLLWMAGRGRATRSLEPAAVRRLVLGAVGIAGLAIVIGGVGLSFERPTLGRFNFMGGVTLTPEFVAVLVGLTLYSSAFAAEIIRGGIDAVGRGQWEAARALGLHERRTLRLVILPQALRVIIPPMTSQYINVVKNSTLGLVVGYPELNFVTATTINQTGQALEGIVILMALFLAISLGASWAMNAWNRRIALVER